MMLSKAFFASRARRVDNQVKNFGNTTIEHCGCPVKAIVDPDFDEVVKTVSPDQLKDTLGKRAIFWFTNAAVKKIKPGDSIKWDDETYYLQPVQKWQFSNVDTANKLLGSTGGVWIMSDWCAIFKDGTLDTIAFDADNRPVVAPVGTADYIGTTTASGVTVGVSPMLFRSPLCCKFGYTVNVNSPAVIGREKKFDLDTADFLFFRSEDIVDSEGNFIVTDGDWVVDLRVRLDKNGRVIGPAPGRGVSRIAGGAYQKISPVDSDSNIAQFQTVAEEHPPESIVRYLKDIQAYDYVPPIYP